LEKRARKERRQKPYRRRRFPVDLLAGVILLIGGILLVWSALTSERGIMDMFVNALLPALMLFMLGALCLLFWGKNRP